MPDPIAERITNILLVDDDDLDVENVRRAFEKANLKDPLWVAGNGEEALRLLRGTSIPAHRRLVLLDLSMPRMSGLETLREIRQDPALSSLSVVILTTSKEERAHLEAFGLHVAGYLIKTTSFDRFVELITALSHYWARVEFP